MKLKRQIGSQSGFIKSFEHYHNDGNDWEGAAFLIHHNPHIGKGATNVTVIYSMEPCYQ